MTSLSEVNRIKDRLRSCQSAEEVAQVADEERETVMAMQDHPELGPLFHHIVNLKKYRLWRLSS